MMFALVFSVLAQAPSISAIAPYARGGQSAVITGENLSNVFNVRVHSFIDSRVNTITEANQIEVVHDSLDAGPSVDWVANGVDLQFAKATGFATQFGRFTTPVESASQARCYPIRVSNISGNSSTVTFNKPELWAVLGTSVSKLYAGSTYTLIGRNMASFRSPITSCWLRRTVTVSSVSNPNGSALVVTTSGSHGLSTGNKVRLYNVTGHAQSINQTYTITSLTATTFSLQGTTGTGGATGSGGQASILYALPVNTQRGGSNTNQFATSAGHVLDFRIPSTVPAGNYKLVCFNNENAWGVSNQLDVTVLSGEESWVTDGGATRGIQLLPIENSLAITSVSNPNGSEYLVTTDDPHHLMSGMAVTISGVSGHAGASPNGRWTVTVVSSTTFLLDATSGTGGAAGSGGIARVSLKSGDDITHLLQYSMFLADFLSTNNIPASVVLPAGTFYLSHTIVVPPNCGIIGAGRGVTILTPNPKLRGWSTSSYDAAKFSTNLNAHDDGSGVYSGYGATVDSGYFSGDKTNSGRACLLLIDTSDVRIEKLSLVGAPDQWRHTVVDVVGIKDDVNEVVFREVEIVMPLAANADDSGVYPYPSGIRLAQDHADFVFSGCRFDATRSYIAPIASGQDQAYNGLKQRFLFENCEFTSSTPINSGSSVGFVGTNWCFHTCEFSKINRCLTSNSGHFPYESVVAFCHFHNTGTDYGGAECVLFENRINRYFSVSSATSTTVVVQNDSFNMKGHIVAIVQGKGMGQYRRIASSSYSAPNNTLTLDSAWSVTPDTTSRVVIDAFPADLTFCSNIWEGTKGGLNLYGSSAGIIVETNSFQDSREGMLIDLVAAQQSGFSELCWSGWTSVAKNVFSDCNAFRLQAVKSSAFASTYTWPMITAVSYWGNEVSRDCASAICTAVGSTTIGSSATATDLDAAPAVLGVHMQLNDYVTDVGRYQRAPVYVRRVVDAPLVVYGRSVRDLVFDGNTIDGQTFSPQTRLARPFSQSLPPATQTLSDVARDVGGIISPSVR